MASQFQPPPTYAMPVIVDERTKVATFNPIWLKWFLDLAANLSAGGSGSVVSVAVATALGVSGTVADPTVNPIITITLGNIEPTSIKITLPVYVNNAAAAAGGLAVGRLYRTGGDPDAVSVVH